MHISMANPMGVLLSWTFSHRDCTSDIFKDVLVPPRSKWKQKWVTVCCFRNNNSPVGHEWPQPFVHKEHMTPICLCREGSRGITATYRKLRIMKSVWIKVLEGTAPCYSCHCLRCAEKEVAGSHWSSHYSHLHSVWSKLGLFLRPLHCPSWVPNPWLNVPS